MKVFRDWKLNRNIKDTDFVYELTDKATGKIEKISDAEKEEYVPVEKIQEYLGNEWKLKHLLGDYDLSINFNNNFESIYENINSIYEWL